MTKKRRNGGRNKHGRGHVKRVPCALSGRFVPKDKAIKRFVVRNIVESAAIGDMQEATAYDGYTLPKIYVKMYYCVDSAVHARIVRVRSVATRRNRAPPRRIRRPRD
mmetsp:Transcript_15835/g.23538  ORF Transcript_15835/g.23538 Transcript_15835/m.23538 type:complete len:107 (+) Transcript_15835:102-422(+)